MLIEIAISTLIAQSTSQFLLKDLYSPTVHMIVPKIQTPLQDKQVLKKIVYIKAYEYNVSPVLMQKIITCESQWRTDVQSKNRYTFTNEKVGIIMGERERSYGLVQINIHYNKRVSIKQAKDPVFAIDYLAKKLSQGKGREWSCYNKVK